MATLTWILRSSISASSSFSLSFVSTCSKNGGIQRRFLSTSSASSLAGRARFYREVSVETASPLWMEMARDSKTLQPRTPIASPISAGVDGTDSASGVVVRPRRRGTHVQRSLEYYQRWLIPRRPADGRTTRTSDPTTPTTTTTTTAATTDISNNDDAENPQEDGWYAICLDGRPLQTPGRSRLVVPTPFLAHAIASEWNAQSPTLKPPQMPLTTMACTVLDQICEQPNHYQQAVLQYLPTDSLSFWADPTVDPELFAEQDRLWTPIVKYLEIILGQPFPRTTADATVVIPNRHRRSTMDPQLVERCQNWVESLDAWHLAILYALTVEAKSIGLALAYLYQHHPLDDTHESSSIQLDWKQVTHLIPACRVEEEVQIAQWGAVEGGHDYDRLNCSIQVHAAVLMHQCLEYERLVQRTTSSTSTS